MKAPAAHSVVFESWGLRLVRPGNVGVVVVVATHGHFDAMRAGGGGDWRGSKPYSGIGLRGYKRRS